MLVDIIILVLLCGFTGALFIMAIGYVAFYIYVKGVKAGHDLVVNECYSGKGAIKLCCNHS
jgi:hypothetical protein